jgi:hypothetical protein
MSSIALGLFDSERLDFEGEFDSLSISTDDDYILVSLTTPGVSTDTTGRNGYLKIRASLVRELAEVLRLRSGEDLHAADDVLDGAGERP